MLRWKVRALSWFIGFTTWVILSLHADVMAQTINIINRIGNFESGTMEGWEKMDARAQYRLVSDAPRAGKFALEVFAPDTGENKYWSPGIFVSPSLNWSTQTPCRVRFCLRALEPYIGYFLALEVQGEDEDGKVYRWLYLAFHGGEKEFARIKQGSKEWGCKDRLNAFDAVRPDRHTYTEWLSSKFQASEWAASVNRWFDFVIDLKDAFKVANAPNLPPKIRLTRVGIFGYIARSTMWQVDEIAVAIGDENLPALPEPPIGGVTSVPIFDEAPVIDGDLSDMCWRKAKVLTLHSQDEKMPPTTVAIGCNSEKLFIAFACSEPNMEKVVVNNTQRDSRVWEDDSVEVFLNVNADRRSYYHIVVNVRGAIYDAYHPPGEGATFWDGDISVKTKVSDNAWFLEIAIPFGELGMDITMPTVWTANFARSRRCVQPNQYAVWSGWFHQPQGFGLLIGLPRSEILSSLTQVKKPGLLGPVPAYDRKRLRRQLHETLRWIADEGLRIYTGWPTDTVVRRRPHRGPDFLRKIAQSRFNVVHIGQGGFHLSPYNFHQAIDMALEARSLGLRVIWHGGYLWDARQSRFAKVRRLVDKDGKRREEIPCRRDPLLWELGLRKPLKFLLRTLKEADAIDLIVGYHMDNETMGRGLICYCDACFGDFLRVQKMTSIDVGPEHRHAWLLERGLSGAYEMWMEEEVASALARIRDEAWRQKPNLLFMFYEFQHTEWLHRAMLRGLGTPQVPCIGWDDATYWTGYTGNPTHVHQAQQAMREVLKYEPLICPSINYVSDPRYPTMSPKRAGMETELLLRVAPGATIYGENRPGADMWEVHLPYWDELEKAHRTLEDEGVLAPLRLTPLEKDRTNRLRQQFDSMVKGKWLKEAGEAFYISDPTPQKIVEGDRTIWRKILRGYDERGDFIYNGTAGTYRFTLDKLPKDAKVKLSARGWWQAEKGRGILVIWLNEKQFGTYRDAFAREKKEWSLELPSKMVPTGGDLRVRIAYFDGDDYFNSIFDNNLILEWVQLEFEGGDNR